MERGEAVMIITRARWLVVIGMLDAIGLIVVNVLNICQHGRILWRRAGVKTFTRAKVGVQRASKKKLRCRDYRFALSGVIGTIGHTAKYRTHQHAGNAGDQCAREPATHHKGLILRWLV